MKYLKKYLELESTENILYNSRDLKISDVSGKLIFFYHTPTTKYLCKIGLLEGCALILDGTNDNDEVRNIPIGSKDRKSPLTVYGIHDTLRWLWNAGKYSEGKDLNIAGVKYYDLKISSIEYDLVSEKFVNRFGETIFNAKKNANTIGDILQEYSKIKKELQ